MLTPITRLLIALLATFWIVAGVVVGAGLVDLGLTKGTGLFAVLMLVNGSVLALAAYFVLRAKTIVDLGALVLLGTNAALSVTDQIGRLDLASLTVSAGALALLSFGMLQASRKTGREA